VPLNTTFFRESWPVLDALLRDTPRDAPVLTFCTGGIRCVKVNAYLQQRLGFTNTHRLAGGIIAYDRWLTEQNQNRERPHTPSSPQQPESGKVVGSQSHAGSETRYARAEGDAVQCVVGSRSAASAEGPVRTRFQGKNFLFDRRRLGYNTMDA
jgi:hypothetical protein